MVEKNLSGSSWVWSHRDINLPAINSLTSFPLTGEGVRIYSALLWQTETTQCAGVFLFQRTPFQSLTQ